MRKAFSKWILDKSKNDSSICIIVGDIGYGLFDEFREKYPKRFINTGLCEQTMIGIAAGMALSGLKPYVYTITPFLIERPYEQIKVNIILNNANVKLIGYADYPKQGPTHSCLDDKIFYKYMDCYYPHNSNDVKTSLDVSYLKEAPAFISLRKDKDGK